jgi:hypothetical protein
MVSFMSQPPYPEEKKNPGFHALKKRRNICSCREEKSDFPVL